MQQWASDRFIMQTSWFMVKNSLLVTQPPSHGGTLLQSIQMIQKVLHSNNNSRHLFSDSLKIIFSALIGLGESRQKAESTLVKFFSNFMHLTSWKYRQQEMSKKNHLQPGVWRPKPVFKGIFRRKFNGWSDTPWHRVRPPLKRSSSPLAHVVLATSVRTAL